MLAPRLTVHRAGSCRRCMRSSRWLSLKPLKTHEHLDSREGVVKQVESAVGSPYSAHFTRGCAPKNTCSLANSSRLAVAQLLDVGDGSELATRYPIRGSGLLSACGWIRSRSPHSRAIVARFDVTSAHSEVPLLDIDSSQLSYTRCDGARAVSVHESCADQCSDVASDLAADLAADRAQIGTQFRSRPTTSTDQSVGQPQ